MLVVYVSGHGFGHATRVGEVLRVLREREPKLPIVVAGGASGQLKGGRHVKYPKDTHMSNLLLAMLDKLGARLTTVGDSTGMLSI